MQIETRSVTLINLKFKKKKKKLFQSLCKCIKICTLELGRESETRRFIPYLERMGLKTTDPNRKRDFIKLPLKWLQLQEEKASEHSGSTLNCGSIPDTRAT